MDEFEYKIIHDWELARYHPDWRIGNSLDQTIALNSLGALGWELVSIYKCDYYFKRKKQKTT